MNDGSNELMAMQQETARKVGGGEVAGLQLPP